MKLFYMGAHRLLMVLLLCSITLPPGAFAQEQVVTGKVTAADNQPIIGAAVLEKNRTGGTVTDEKGTFSIRVSSPAAVLEFRMMGFETQEQAVTGKTALHIILAEDRKQLGEIVVTAMGIRKEVKKLGYSVQEVKGSELVKARDANPVNSLAGKVAGLTVGASAEMLGRPELVLRGSKDLLFVVDGVPVNSDTWNLNPDDIESYTILKGANAAALYGFRGQNGAIVINTKRGTKNGKGWQVDINTSTMLESGFISVPDIQTEYGRGTAYAYSYGDQLYDNKQRLPEWGPRFEGQPVKQYDSPWDPTTRKRTPTPWVAKGKDNFDKFMETGIVNTNNISLSTANDKSDFRISLSNMNQKGMAPNTRLHIYSLALNGGYQLSSKWNVEASLNFNRQHSPNIPDVSYGPNSYVYLFQVYGSADYDIDDLKDIYKGPQGVQDLMPYAQEYGRDNSAWFMAKKWLRGHDKTDVNGYVKLGYRINDEMRLSLRSQITTWNQLRTEQVPAGANLNAYVPWWYFGWYGDYREDRRELSENNTDLILNYNKSFGKISLSGLAGGNLRSFSYNSLWATTKALAIPNVYALTNSKEQYSAYTWSSRMQVYSGFYSLDLSLGKHLTLSHTGRVDHVSTLARGYNTFYYPSVAFSTVLSDYLRLPAAISFLKVRGSYANVKGALTAATIPSAFSQVTGKSTNAGLLNYGADLFTSYDGPTYKNQNSYSLVNYYNNQPSVDYSGTIANPQLRPFTVSSYEAGIDAKFLKNRLTVDFTWFTSLNGPQIFAFPVPSSTTFTARNLNAITSRKTGFEVAITGSPVKNPGGFNWDVTLNYATYREKLDKIYGNEPAIALNGHNYRKGERLDAIYGTGFVRDGSNNIIYSGGLPLRAPSDINNNILLGYANPDFTFGVHNRFSFRNISVGFQVDGRVGGSIYDQVYKDGMNGGTALESASGLFGRARYAEWQSTAGGTKAPAAAYVAPGVVITSGTPQYNGGQITNMKDLTFAPNDKATTVQSFVASGIANVQEYWMVSRSFAKLREVNVTYNVPGGILRKKGFFSAASISLVGRNLLYFAERKDMDLDQFASGFNDSDISLNNIGVVQSATARRFGFNINLSF